jgi:hypothetical protein
VVYIHCHDIKENVITGRLTQRNKMSMHGMTGRESEQQSRYEGIPESGRERKCRTEGQCMGECVVYEPHQGVCMQSVSSQLLEQGSN